MPMTAIHSPSDKKVVRLIAGVNLSPRSIPIPHPISIAAAFVKVPYGITTFVNI